MAFWRTLTGFFTGSAYRQAGLQSGFPAQYSGTPAVSVTPDIALGLSSVWACTRLITETVSTMPIRFYKRDPNTGIRTEIADHPLAELFRGKVNRWQNRQEFFETMTYQLVLQGNAYALKQKNSQGRLIGLTPLMSQQMVVGLKDDGSIVYEYNNGKEVIRYSEAEIWHIKLFGNGIMGLSPLGFARNSIAIGQGAEQAVTNIYRNGGKPSGLLTIDKTLTKEQRESVKTTFSGVGEGNESRLYVLEHGFKYEPISLSPQDIELLSSRKFQIEDIARFFGVPSVLINDTSAGTTWGSGIQQIVQGFYKLGIRPYLERYEASMLINLLNPLERIDLEIEFDFDYLIRADQTERVKAYKEAVQGGIMTPNEARKQEGWIAKEGGDSLLVQQQMVALERLGEVNAGVVNG